jgi:hypothetical protein
MSQMYAFTHQLLVATLWNALVDEALHPTSDPPVMPMRVRGADGLWQNRSSILDNFSKYDSATMRRLADTARINAGTTASGSGSASVNDYGTPYPGS